MNLSFFDDTTVNRKQALKKIGTLSKDFAKIAAPFAAIGAFSSKAQAQFKNLEVTRALNALLQIEYMQELFYVDAIITKGFLTGENRAIFGEIKNNQQAHVVLLKTLILGLGVENAPQLSFDFTAGGQFNPFGNFDDFLMLAQVIEDTAAGIYKNKLQIIHDNGAEDIIQRTIMRAHSTETRHAYIVRFLRGQRSGNNLNGWITGKDNNFVPQAAQDIYTNEDTVIQNDINVPSVTDVSDQTVREGWDEKVNSGPANDIFQLFKTTPNIR